MHYRIYFTSGHGLEANTALVFTSCCISLSMSPSWNKSHSALTVVHEYKSGHWHCPGLASNLCHYDLQADSAGSPFPTLYSGWHPLQTMHTKCYIQALKRHIMDVDEFLITVSFYECSSWLCEMALDSSSRHQYRSFTFCFTVWPFL